MTRVLSAVNVLLALGFAAAAVVQWNDPDPLRWMAIYGAAAGVCLLWRRVRWAWIAAFVVALAALAWALCIAVGIERLAPIEMFRPMEMKGGPVEETREVFGLALVAAWMVFLLFTEKRARAR